MTSLNPRRVKALSASVGVHVAGAVVLFALAALQTAREPAAVQRAPAASELALVQPIEASERIVSVESRPATTALASGRLEIPNFSFDPAKIIAHANSLFPFLTEELRIRAVRQAADRAARGKRSLYWVEHPVERKGGTALVLTEAEIDALVQKAWSRRERWHPFQSIREIVANHDANRGAGPLLLQRYAEGSLLQPYVEGGSRDPMLWTMLGIAADHGDFLRFIETYVGDHPGTRVSVELLFILDELIQGSRDTLQLLLDTKVPDDLPWTLIENRGALRTIDDLQKYYGAVLKRRQLSAPTVGAHYDYLRAQVLESIMAMTPDGYRESDARYLLGAIWWRRGLRAEAIDVWTNLEPRRAPRFSQAVEMLASIATRQPLADAVAPQVDAVLRQADQWYADYWRSRLREFGYSADTF